MRLWSRAVLTPSPPKKKQLKEDLLLYLRDSTTAAANNNPKCQGNVSFYMVFLLLAILHNKVLIIHLLYMLRVSTTAGTSKTAPVATCHLPRV